MRIFMLLSGLVVVSALGAVGCGGGPCADYCGASLECAAGGCELADEGKAKGVCTDACQAGLDAVPDADGRKAVEDCLACIAPLYKESCELSEDSFLSCQDACFPAAESIQAWSEGFGAAIEDEVILCVDGTPAGGGNCTYSSGGDGTTSTCGVECESGDMMAGAECQTTGGMTTCQCTIGANQGTSFSSDCDALDSDVVWDVCN